MTRSELHVVAGDRLRAELEDPLQHHRHDHERAGRGAGRPRAASPRGRSAAAARASRPAAAPSVKCAKPQEWNIGAAIIVVSRARSGIFENSAAAGSSESGCLRAAPFGVPVVPEVRITTRPGSAGGCRSDVVAARDQLLEQRVAPPASAPSARSRRRSACARGAPSLDELGELLVVDHRAPGPRARARRRSAGRRRRCSGTARSRRASSRRPSPR